MKKTPIVLASLALIFASVFGATGAAWAVTDNADQFGIKITTACPQYKISYYLPNKNDTNYLSFVKAELTVDEGINLYDALSSHTSGINGFSFVQWHETNSHFRTDDDDYDPIINTTTVTEDITVYAKYVMDNTLYYYHTVDEKGYYVTSTIDNYSLNASKVYYGDRIYSYDGVEGTGVTLNSTTGVYRFTKNTSDWTIERKITFNIGDVSSWWTSNSAHTHIYYENSDGGHFLTDITFSSNSYTAYFDPSYTKFVVCRSSSSSTSWTDFWNQTVDAYLDNKGSGTEVYSKDRTTLYVKNTKAGEKQNYTW